MLSAHTKHLEALPVSGFMVPIHSSIHIQLYRDLSKCKHEHNIGLTLRWIYEFKCS